MKKGITIGGLEDALREAYRRNTETLWRMRMNSKDMLPVVDLVTKPAKVKRKAKKAKRRRKK